MQNSIAMPLLEKQNFLTRTINKKNKTQLYLNCHSNFSLGYGTITVKQLIAKAASEQVKTLALTDVNNTSAIWEFIRRSREAGIKPLVGIDYKNPANNKTAFVGLAKNTLGIAELNRILTARIIENYDDNHFKIPTQNFEDFENIIKIYPFEPNKTYQLKANEYIGIHPNQVNQLMRSPALMWTYQLVVLQPITFFKKQDYHLHLLLQAIHRNELITKLNKNICAKENELWQSEASIKQAFTNFPQIVKNTEHLLEKCEIDFQFFQNNNKKTYLANTQADAELLEKLALQGFEYRYPDKNNAALLRLLKELRIINELNFPAYYLINYDIIKYAEHKNYFYVGRGSGANSMVAYCLKITDVDPMELDLYFERFLNRHRTSPPDFDIDFSHKDRDDIYSYVFSKYGSENVALLGAYVTYQRKAASRELGKVFGLPKTEIDQIIYHIERGKFPDAITQKVNKYGKLLIDFPKHLSIHASGMLISEKSVFNYSALHLPPKNLMTVQFDMYVAEDIGLYKFDILSQRGLSHIKDCIDLVKSNREYEIDIHNVKQFKEDPLVRERIRAAKTIGCFYIESPAMRILLTKLRCSDYLTLVAASSIIRPGVASSGMMRAYIERFHDPKKVDYLHPKMEELLQETYGVMVYQEDVIKVAHHFAGLGLDESDVLRRGMSGKFRSKEEMQRIKDKFMSNCEERGYQPKIYREVWRQIESFSGYSFSKAHSASYAVESYQSLYLKAHFPLEFITAVLNNFGGFYRSEFYFHEAKRLGASIESICINRSLYYNRLVEKSIFIGFVHIKDLEYKLAIQIIEERNKNGLYQSFENFLERIKISYEQVNLLIRLKAFRFTGLHKAELLWRAVVRNKKKTNVRETVNALFKAERKTFELPNFTETVIEDAYDQFELLNFPLYSPFDLIDDRFKQGIMSKHFKENINQIVTALGYLVTIKKTSTRKGERMLFSCFIDEKGDFFDTVHFPQVTKKFPLRGSGVYRMVGKITEEFDVCMLEVNFIEKIPYLKPKDLEEE